MAEYRNNRRLIESVDPVTGETIYTDEATGQIVSRTPGVPTAAPGGATTEYHETVVEEQPAHLPGTGAAASVSQRTVTSGAGHVAPAAVAPGVHTQETEVYSDDPYAPRRTRNYKIQQAIYLVFGIIEALLGIRFVLSLLAANPNSGFGSFIYGITAPFMLPFRGLFGEPAAGPMVIEFNALVAIVVYALLAWLLVKLVWLAGGETRSATRTSRVNRRIDQ